MMVSTTRRIRCRLYGALLVVLLLLVASMAPVGAAPSNTSGIHLVIGGTQVQSDVSPLIQNGRTLVPLRAVGEFLGATVSWNSKERSASVQLGATRIALTIGSGSALVDGRAVPLDVPAQIIEGRTMVPLRFIAESFGAEVRWDPGSRTVFIHLASAAQAHPSILIRQTDLPTLRALRERAEPSPGFPISPEEVYSRLRAAADTYLTTPLAYPAPCPDGLPYCLEQPLADRRLTRSGWQAPYVWSAEPPPPQQPGWTGFPIWTPITRGGMVRAIVLAGVGLIEDNQAMRRRAADMALQVAQWPDWGDPQTTPSLDLANLITMTSLVYDLTYHDLTPVERERLRLAIANKGVARLLSENGRVQGPLTITSERGGNVYVTLSVALGYAALALRGEHPAAPDWLKVAVDLARLNIEAQGVEDGATFEGAYYGRNVVADLTQFGRAVDRLSLHGPAGPLLSHPFFERLARHVLSITDLTTSRAQVFGDGPASAVIPYVEAMEVLAAQGNQEALAFVASLNRRGLVDENYDDGLHNDPDNLYTFLRLPQLMAQTPSPRQDQSLAAAYPQVGYTVLREGMDSATLAYLRSGPEGRPFGHNKYDQNNLTIWHGGVQLLSASGNCVGLPDFLLKFCKGTHGQNSMVMDAVPLESHTGTPYMQDPSTRILGYDQMLSYGGRLLDFFTAPGLHVARSEASGAYATDLTRFERTAAYLPGGCVAVYDRFEAEAPHRYSVLFHGAQGSLLSQNGGLHRITKGGRSLYLNLHSPGGEVRAFDGYAFEAGAQSRRFGPYLEVVTPLGTSATSTALLCPTAETGVPPSVTYHENGAGIVAADPMGESLIFFNPSTGPVTKLPLTNPGFEADPGFATWSPSAGEPNRYLSLDDAVAFKGRRSARIDLRGTASPVEVYLNPGWFEVPEGAWFSCDIAARIEGGGTASIEIVATYFGPKGYVSSTSITGIRPNGWQRVRSASRVPPGADRVSCQYRTKGYGATAWFDDARYSYEAESAVSPQSSIVVGTNKLSTDGTMALVRRNAEGEYDTLALVGGTHLRLNGRTLLAASIPLHLHVRLDGSGGGVATFTQPESAVSQPVSISLKAGFTTARLGGKDVTLCLAGTALACDE